MANKKNSQKDMGAAHLLNRDKSAIEWVRRHPAE